MDGVEFAGGVAGGKDHAFRNAEAHLARGKVGDDDDVFADKVFGFVGALDAGEDLAGLGFAYVCRHLEELVGAFDGFGGEDLGDA